jgi:hypothetical protein
MAEQNPKVATPAYVSYKSFVRFINGLRDHLPSRIDRSILGGMSGSGQSALLGSLEYLGLIDQGGKPLPALDELITLNGPQYSAKLKQLLTASYEFLFDGIDLKRATGSQVHEAFRKKNVQGSTLIKAIAFFLAAAKDAGIEVSKHVKPPGAVKSPAQRRTGQRGTPRPNEEDGEDDDEDEGHSVGQSFAPDVHPALAGILMQLPPSGETLSKRDRDRFMKAFEAVLTLVYPTDEEDELLK